MGVGGIMGNLIERKKKIMMAMFGGTDMGSWSKKTVTVETAMTNSKEIATWLKTIQSTFDKIYEAYYFIF